jgi:hypothetical protein
MRTEGNRQAGTGNVYRVWWKSIMKNDNVEYFVRRRVDIGCEGWKGMKQAQDRVQWWNFFCQKYRMTYYVSRNLVTQETYILCNGYQGSFPGVKRPGRGVNDPPHIATRLKKEYNICSPSGPSWPVLVWTLSLPLLSPLCRVSIIIYLKQTMFLRHIVLQL